MYTSITFWTQVILSLHWTKGCTPPKKTPPKQKTEQTQKPPKPNYLMHNFLSANFLSNSAWSTRLKNECGHKFLGNVLVGGTLI